MNAHQRHIQLITNNMRIAVDSNYENSGQHVYHCPLKTVDLKKGAAEGRWTIKKELPGATVIAMDGTNFAVVPAFDMITVEKATFS